MFKSLRCATLLLLVAGVAGCHEASHTSFAGPDAQLTAAHSGLPLLAGKSLLQWNSPLAQSLSDTATISNDTGGWLSVPGAGIDVYVPAGALGSDPDSTLFITLTAPAGSDVEWEFAPHGYTFHEELEIRVDASNTSAAYLLGQPLLGGIVPGLLGIYFEPGWFGLDVLEVFSVELDSGDFVFETDHFSGYALAM